MIYKPFPEVIGEIVSIVRQNYTQDNMLPYYDYGMGLEVVNRLSNKSDNINFYDKKYPLIWTLIDGSVNEDVRPRNAACTREVKNATIIICAETKPEYTSKERYDNVFIPTLRPLYDSFMYHLRKSSKVNSKDNYSHGYHENLFWGRDGLYGHVGNVFNDRLDAIIIDNFNLLLVETC